MYLSSTIYHITCYPIKLHVQAFSSRKTDEGVDLRVVSCPMGEVEKAGLGEQLVQLAPGGKLVDVTQVGNAFDARIISIPFSVAFASRMM